MNKIFIKNLSSETTKSKIKEFLSKAGNVKNISIFQGINFEDHSIFALAEMDSAEGAKKAIEILSGSNLDGKLVYISKAKPIKGGDNNMEKTL